MSEKQPCFLMATLISFLIFLFPLFSFAAFDGEFTVEELRQKNLKSTNDLDFMI